MRVTKSQIVHGVTGFVQDDLLPKLDGDKAVQIIATVAVNAAMANSRLIDAVLDNGMVKALLEDDGSGTYEIDGLLSAMRTAVEQHGYFPVTIPAIPLLSPREITLRLDAGDMNTLRSRIENAV